MPVYHSLGTSEELQAVAASHGWNLEGIHLFDLSSVDDLLKAESQNTLFHPSEVEVITSGKAGGLKECEALKAG